MAGLTPEQIQWVTDKVAKALQEALTEVAGINPQQAKNERLAARIVAALARSDEYIGAHPALEPVLRFKAMPKTLLRRALGGNAVNINEALDLLVASGKVRYHPANRVTGQMLQVYELVE